MLILEAVDIKKYYNDRLIFSIDNLKIYDKDRIGIVGLNGVGKTTLVSLLSKKIDPDSGYVNLSSTISTISQLGDVGNGTADKKLTSEFNIHDIDPDYMSGGEKTRLKIALSLSTKSSLLIADEPTCNLDIEGIELLTEKLIEYKGAILVISHDRELLDQVCDKILELEDGKVTLYNGNYSSYRTQKEALLARQQFEYEKYTKEKKMLEESILAIKDKVKGMKKAPSRMGNSEARLHKMTAKTKGAKLNRSVKAIETRIEKLDAKEKPKDMYQVKIDIQDGKKINSPVAISFENVYKSFGSRVLLEDVNFKVFSGKKVALIGGNGTGKTTLLKMLLSREDGVNISKNVRYGYFSQDLNLLDDNKTILENIMEDSAYKEDFIRLILARLLFRGDDVFKKVSVLSGGERVKASLARIILKNVNTLILDEPTNYLDISSMEALEEVLQNYEGTMLFVSHDLRFIDNVADNIVILKDKKAFTFAGNYHQYLENQEAKKSKQDVMVLENKLSELVGRLSTLSPKDADKKDALNVEYFATLSELRKIREQ